MKKVLIPLFLFIIAIIASDRFLLPYLTESGSKATVPDVRNMSYENAEVELRHAGLRATKSYNVRYLPDVRPDLVIDQSPEAGAVVKPGRSIYLMLNRQDKPIYPMPDLVGRTEAEARQELERLGMIVSQVQNQAVSTPDQNGRVLSQSVQPEVSLRLGSAVTFIVGRFEQEPVGLRRVIVPDIIGMSADQARGVIVKNGLSVGKISYEHSDLLVPDTVITQKPAANAMVQYGQPINLTVAASSN